MENEKELQEAKDLINRYGQKVYPFEGSGYLTGNESNQAKFSNGKTEALYLADRMLSIRIPYTQDRISNSFWFDHNAYWVSVRTILEQIKYEDVEWEFKYVK